MSGTILPGNFSDLERDLDVALSRIEQVEIPIAVLWDPWQCPVAVLPYLAWALSVDVWVSGWPDATKRRVVSEAISLHRVKGTRPAVEDALLSAGYTARLAEWFEYGGARGTFRVECDISQHPTSDELITIARVVRNVKPTRAHFVLRASLNSLCGVGLSAIPSVSNRVICRPYQQSIPIASVVGRVATVPVSVIKVVIS